MKLSQPQWALLWIANGGAPSKADLASAVVMAESGGDATSDSNPCCKGGYQINVEVGNTSRGCAMNPICATKWSIKESRNGKDWSAWEAYTNGSYGQYIGGSHMAKHRVSKKKAQSMLVDLKGPFGLPDVPFPGPDVDLFGGVSGIDPTDLLGGKSAGDLLEVPGEITSFFQHAGELLFTPDGWLRVGKILGGSLLVLWGLNVLVKESTGVDTVKTGKKLGEAAATAAVLK